MKIAVTKETRHNEKRVSIVPEVAKRIIALGTEVIVETGAGECAGFGDEAYCTNGATIAYDKIHLYQDANIVSWVKRPENETEELRHIPSNAMIVAFFDPLKFGQHLQYFAQKGSTTMALELLPHNTETEKMDAFSAMGKFAGEIAYQNALTTLTLQAQIRRALTILIIGSGNVGMAAAKKAHQEGNRIIIVSTNAKYQSFIEEKLFGVFVLLAKDLVKQQERVQELISEYKPDIIITSARRYGQKSPKLITDAAIDAMKPCTVIEDLTASLGGNTPFTQADQEIKVKNNVLISNKSNYPSQQPSKASESYAECFWHLLKHVITHTHTEPNYDISTDPLLSRTIVTHQGKLCFTPRINITIKQ
ncbi:MAG: hypothetical protein ABFS56_14840 [Pseudomonadota bacterium]